MSSLYSLVRSGKFYDPQDFRWKDILPLLKTPECKFVNVQTVWDSIVTEENMVSSRFYGDINKELIQCTPPYGVQWLEFISRTGFRVALLIVRSDTTGIDALAAVRHQVRMRFLIEVNGRVEICPPMVIAEIDEDGTFLGRKVYIETPSEQKVGDYDIESFAALFSCAFMNCKNVQIRPATETSKTQPINPRKSLPMCVWHTIHITAAPKFESEESNEEKRHREAMAHFVRGHFRDCRKHGLFGKHKGVYWIPDHKRGSEELGLVVPEYVLA